eukprot:3839401-Lingulodinium_polyedra.AAC.1
MRLARLPLELVCGRLFSPPDVEVLLGHPVGLDARGRHPLAAERLRLAPGLRALLGDLLRAVVHVLVTRPVVVGR